MKRALRTRNEDLTSDRRHHTEEQEAKYHEIESDAMGFHMLLDSHEEKGECGESMLTGWEPVDSLRLYTMRNPTRYDPFLPKRWADSQTSSSQDIT